tara:strand:+ start:101 stop:292 length:192 start_codon:yes stop_codon:yes gene_type:complete
MEFITSYRSRLFLRGYKLEVVSPADQNHKLRLRIKEHPKIALKRRVNLALKKLFEIRFENGTL